MQEVLKIFPEVFSSNVEMDVARKIGTSDVKYIQKEIKKQDEMENKITSKAMVSIPTKNKLQLQVKV